MTTLSNYLKMKRKPIVYIVLKQTMKKKYKILALSFYNYITPSGLPPHNLTWKENTIMMLLIKLQNQIMVVQWNKGLIILQLMISIIDAQMINVEFNGNRVFIPRPYLSLNTRKR